MKKTTSNKTNAMRLLEAASIAFRTVEYEEEEEDISSRNLGLLIATRLGQPAEQVFKTLVLQGDKNGYLVCCIPVAEELDLKKVANAAGEKKVDMIPMKQLLAITGYIRGGCSPVGMKKEFPTFFDETVELYEEVAVSAGARGIQMIVNPTELLGYCKAKTADIVKW